MICNVKQILNMLEEYKSKVYDTSYVIFIDNNTYKKIKKDLENVLFLKIVVTNIMPENTNAIIMTRKQYDDLFKSWL